MNAYSMLKAWGTTRSQMPFPVTFTIKKKSVDVERCYMLCDTLGKGETVFLMALEPVEGDASLWKLRTVLDHGYRVPACVTSQLALCSLLKASEAAGGGAALTQSSVRLSRSAFTPVAHDDEGRRSVAFRLGAVLRDGVVPLKHKLGDGSVPAAAAKQEQHEVKPFGLDLDAIFGVKAPAGEGLGEDDLPEPPKAKQPKLDKAKAKVKAVGDDDDDSGGGNGGDEERPEDIARIPNGSRLGIVGYQVAPTDRAMCLVCNGKIFKGVAKFFWRQHNGKAEKSMHCACYNNGLLMDRMAASVRMRSDTRRFLIDGMNSGTLSDMEQNLFGDALDVTDRTEGGSSASGSLGSGGAGSAAVPSSTSAASASASGGPATSAGPSASA